MTETHTLTEANKEPEIYEIRVKGQLDARWTNWFGDLTMTHDETGNTLFVGPVTDQAALFGLLRKVRDSGMHLLSINQVGSVR